MGRPLPNNGDAAEKMCEFDEDRAVFIHSFAPGQCRCLCGLRVVRQPVKRNRVGRIGNFGRKQTGNSEDQ